MTTERDLMVIERINKLHDEEGMSWRKIAELPEHKGIVPAGSLCSFANGTWEPKDEDVRRALGLDIIELIPQIRNTKTGQFSRRSDA